jgi:hypothetical protein
MSDPITALKPYQQRIVEEKAELDERLSKLNAFIAAPAFGAIHLAERERMSEQSEVMACYSHILRERIAAFST